MEGRALCPLELESIGRRAFIFLGIGSAGKGELVSNGFGSKYHCGEVEKADELTVEGSNEVQELGSDPQELCDGTTNDSSTHVICPTFGVGT